MLKFMCLLFIFAAVANAETLTLNFDSIEFGGDKENPYIGVKETKGKSIITWKTNVNQGSTSLRVTLVILYFTHGKTQNATLDNLCNEYNKNTLEGALRQFILKIMANTEKCPIQKGAMAIISEPIIFPYNMENPICGPFRSEIKIFKNADSDNSHPLIDIKLQGTNNGC